MLWLGCALWLKDHGAEFVVRVAPEVVVPLAVALCDVPCSGAAEPSFWGYPLR